MGSWMKPIELNGGQFAMNTWASGSFLCFHFIERWKSAVISFSIPSLAGEHAPSCPVVCVPSSTSPQDAVWEWARGLHSCPLQVTENKSDESLISNFKICLGFYHCIPTLVRVTKCPFAFFTNITEGTFRDTSWLRRASHWDHLKKFNKDPLKSSEERQNIYFKYIYSKWSRQHSILTFAEENLACMTGTLWAKRSERDISRGARDEGKRKIFFSSRASRSCRAPREISRSPHLAHKVPVMQAKENHSK